MKTLIGLVLFVLSGSVPATAQSEQEVTVPATAQSEQEQPEQEVIVPATAQPEQGMTVTDIATVAGTTVGFLGLVWVIVNSIVSRSEGRVNKKVEGGEGRINEKVEESEGRINKKVEESEGRINKKVDKTQMENKEAHERIVDRLETVNRTLGKIREDIGFLKGKVSNRNRSDDA